MRMAPIMFALLFAGCCAQAADDSPFPGLPPDCWTEDREYHVQGPTLWESIDPSNNPLNEELSFSIVSVIPQGDRVVSPNKGYSFVSESGIGFSSITIDGVQGHYWQVRASSDNGGYPAFTTAEWVNEKLVFARLWWGRVMFDDLILDVENETVVFTQSGTAGWLARQQAQETCKVSDVCTCIEPDND